jgi:hypothetical protein
MMFPLDSNGVLYTLEDEYGNQIGVGSREVCQTLLYLITTSPLMRKPTNPAAEPAVTLRAPAKTWSTRARHAPEHPAAEADPRPAEVTHAAG